MKGGINNIIQIHQLYLYICLIMLIHMFNLIIYLSAFNKGNSSPPDIYLDSTLK